MGALMNALDFKAALDQITFISHFGSKLYPPFGYHLSFPYAMEKHTAALYKARLDCILAVQTKYFMILDDTPDRLTPDFATGCIELIDALESNPNAFCASGREKNKLDERYFHHAVLCRAEIAQQFHWPRGCFNIEELLYKRPGVPNIEVPILMYEWNGPQENSASMWPTTPRAIFNSWAYLSGKFPVTFESDLVFWNDKQE